MEMNMANALPGVSVYLSKADIAALHHAHDHLYTQHESCGVEVPELVLALGVVNRLLDKARKAQRSSKRREVIAQALNLADE
jgi:Mor family transcriptional regulator